MSFRMCFFGLAFSLLVSTAGGGGTLPTAEDIDRLAENAKSISSGFKTASNELRFQYEYSGRFLKPADKEKLRTLAAQGSEQLRKIAESQQEIKSRIEAYEGDDWDDRYGETGLWRKLFADLYESNVHKCEIDFHLALCSAPPAQEKTLHEILTRIDSLTESYDTAYMHFLRAKALGLLGRTGAAYGLSARRKFDLLAERSDMRHSTAFKIAIERIKLLGPGPEDRLSKLTDELAQSTDVNDLELILSLAILQRRLNRPEAFEKTVRNWPQIENLLGSLTLADLSSRLGDRQFDFRKVTILEAELAAQAAWADGPETHANLLRRLAPNQKLQTPLVFYVTALASARTSPIEAGNLLIKAATLQKQSKSDRLDIEAEKIAEQAAMLLCNSYLTGQADHSMLLGVLISYRNIAGGPTNEQLDYCYAIALMETGEKEKGAELLRKIAQDPTATRRHRAKLDLITSAITRDHYTDPNKRADVSRDLLDLLEKCSEQNDPAFVRPDAIRIYCQLLLQSPQTNEAQKVLNILTDSEVRNSADLKAFKSKALRYLDRLHESAECLAGVCQTDNPEHALEAGKLLVLIIERFEQLQYSSADPAKLQKNSLAIARYCERISLSGYGLIPAGQAQLYVAEISLFDAAKNPQKLAQIDKLLGNLPDKYKGDHLDFLRCRARLLAEQGKFAAAGGLWAKVASIEKRRSAQPNRRNAQWWRAKYYELHSFSKIPQTQDKDVAHSIEVLQSSFANIPPLWAERLNLLKQQCLKDDDSTRRL